MLNKDKDHMIEFALTLNKLLPNIKDDMETFQSFLQQYLTIEQYNPSQNEQSTIISDKFVQTFEKYKTSGSLANKPVIGLVEGVFDMLHFGHFNAIRQASLCCDKLIVGVNCDETVQVHKGYVN